MKGESHMKEENIKGVWLSQKIMLILFLWELSDPDRQHRDSCPDQFWFVHINSSTASTAYLNPALHCGHLLSLHLTTGPTATFL